MCSFLLQLMVLFAFSAAVSAAPTAKVIHAQTGKPVESVHVYTKGEVNLQKTNAAGDFDLGPFAPDDEIFFQHKDFIQKVLTAAEIEKAGNIVSLAPVRYTTDEVVVEGYRFGNDRKTIPQETDEIIANQVEFQNPRTSGDLLESNGSVYVQRSQFGGGSPMLRGFTANSVLLVYDGVRMNNAIYRAGNLQNVITIDPNTVASTDVLYGPGSVQYGSDALGGVMVFNSPNPLPSLSGKTEVSASGFTRYGTAAEEKTAGAQVSFGLRKWAFYGGYTHSDFGDLRTGANRSDAYPDYGVRREYVVRENGQDVIVQNDELELQRPTGYSQANFLGKARFFPSNHLNATYALLYATSTDIPRYDRLEAYRNGQLRFADWHYGPQEWMLNRLTLQATDGGTIYDDAQLTLAHQDYQESRHDRAFGDDILNSRTEDVQVVSVNADLDRNLGSGKLFYGAEAVFNEVESTAKTVNIVTGETGPLDTRYPDGGATTSNVAMYAGWRVPATNWLLITAGARYTQFALHAEFHDTTFYNFPFDEIEYSDGAPTASLGAVCSSGSWTFRGVLSSGFRAPNVDDVGKIFGSTQGTVVFPNPDLKSEYMYNAEAGVDKDFGDKFNVGSTVYYSHLTDAIVIGDAQFNGQDSVEYGGVMSKVTALQNTGKAYLTGFNIHLRAKYTDHLSVKSVVNYGAGRDTENDLPMRPIPPLFGQTSILYEEDKWAAEFYTRFNAWKQEHDIPLEGGEVSVYTTDGVPEWWTLNLRGSVKPVDHLELIAGLENIFDLHYRPYGSGISAPGRNFIVSLRASL